MTLRSKTTPWFDGYVKPVRSGAYERLGGAFSWFSVEAGLWGCSAATPQRAKDMSELPSLMQSLPWRGRVEQKP